MAAKRSSVVTRKRMLEIAHQMDGLGLPNTLHEKLSGCFVETTATLAALKRWPEFNPAPALAAGPSR